MKFIRKISGKKWADQREGHAGAFEDCRKKERHRNLLDTK